MAYDEGNARSSDGPTCLVAILAPFLVLCAIVGYATFTGGGVTQSDEDTGTVQVLTWHGWAPAGETARQLSAPPAPAYGGQDNPTVAPLPTVAPTALVVVVAPTGANIAPAPAAGTASGNASRYTGYSAVEPAASAAPPAGFSPWTLLGWILVVLAPVALLTVIALAVHRHLVALRLRRAPVSEAGSLHPVPGPAAPTGRAAPADPGRRAVGPAGETPPPASTGSTQIAAFLGSGPALEAAAGGNDDAPVLG